MYHVGGVGELSPYFTLGHDAFGPVHQKRIRHAATVGFPFPASERRTPAKVQPQAQWLKYFGPTSSSSAARFCCRSSGTLLKNLFSLTEPCGSPSALAPLSETSMISGLSSSPIWATKSIGRCGGRCAREDPRTPPSCERRACARRREACSIFARRNMGGRNQ